MLTEFFDNNNPAQTPLPSNPQTGLSDHTLTFGTMQMVGGRAFVIGDTNQSNSHLNGTPTYKSWLQLNGRNFLLEEVPYSRIAPQLKQLPTTGRVNVGKTNFIAGNSILNQVSDRRLLPPARPVRASTNPQA